MIDSQEFAQAVKADKTVVINQGKTRLWCCSARDEKRIASLKAHLNISKREGINIWVDNDSRLNQHVTEVSEAAWDVLDATEGEITLILASPKNIAKSALFEDQSVAITITKELWSLKMMNWLKSPLAVFRSQDGNEELPIDLHGEVYVLNLPAQLDQSIVQGYSVIKLAEDGEIKIIRNQGQKLVTHI